MIEFFKTVVYIPLYNVFALVLSIPYIDAGIAVIVFTLVIRALLFPLSKKAILSQIAMQQIQPEMKKIQEQYKDNRQVQAQKLLDLYRTNKVNPFSGILIILIQIPIIISLYHIFSSGALSSINPGNLYSFIPVPPVSDHTLFGFIDLLEKNLILALLAGVTQYFVAHMQFRFGTPTGAKGGSQFQQDLQKSLSVQMKYFFPILTTIITVSLPAVIGLYWLTSNLVTMYQEYILTPHRKKLSEPHSA